MALLLFGLVALLGWAVQHRLVQHFDEAGLRLLSGAAAPAMWRSVTCLGDSWARLSIAAVATMFLFARRRYFAAVAFGTTVLGGLALNEVAKLIASRPRPALLPHLDHVAGYSFPSGHSAGITVLALGLAIFLPPVERRTPALMLATGVLLLVGLSRIALAVHWPSDVLAGWMEGFGWVLLVRTWAGDRRG